MLSAEQIQANYEKHLIIIDKYITGERKQKVLDMVEALGENYIMAPASSKTWFHSAFPGGYLDHVNKVVEFSVRMMKLYSQMGGNIDFTEEELVFSALFHDLGKIGDGEQPNYLPQTDKWRREKMQEVYSINGDSDFMLIPDRSLFVLQKFGIPLNKKEYLGIRLHDGVFDEANKAYFINYNPDSKLKSNLVHILHTADYLAAKVEVDIEKHSS